MMYEKVWDNPLKDIWKANLNVILEKPLHGNTKEIKNNQTVLHKHLQKGVKEKYIPEKEAIKIWWNCAAEITERRIKNEP